MRRILMQKLARNVRPELLKDSADGSFASDDHTVTDRQPDSRIVGRVIQIREGTRSDVAQDVGIVGLPLARIVMFADDAGCGGIEQPVRRGSMTEAEITRVLMQQCRQKAVADHGAIECVKISGTRALTEALGAPRKPSVRVGSFLVSRHNNCGRKRDRIDSRTEGEIDLLLRSQRNRIAAIRSIERRKDTKHALMFLLLDLLRSFFALLLFRGGFIGRSLRTG